MAWRQGVDLDLFHIDKHGINYSVVAIQLIPIMGILA